MSNQKREYKTLLSVLANGSTENARALLKKHSGQDAKDTRDLEVKLAKVYAHSPRKIDIEKEFAEIHPHKDFILKYLAPKPEKKEEKVEQKVEEVKQEPKKEIVSELVLDKGYVNFNGHPPCGNPNCPYCARYFDGSRFQGYSNCGGNPNCNCGTSSACGCSSFAGSSNAEGQTGSGISNNQALMVVGIVSVVALVGMVMYLHSNKK